jgi:hypothetical protein
MSPKYKQKNMDSGNKKEKPVSIFSDQVEGH